MRSGAEQPACRRLRRQRATDPGAKPGMPSLAWIPPARWPTPPGHREQHGARSRCRVQRAIQRFVKAPGARLQRVSRGSAALRCGVRRRRGQRLRPGACRRWLAIVARPARHFPSHLSRPARPPSMAQRGAPSFMLRAMTGSTSRRASRCSNRLRRPAGPAAASLARRPSARWLSSSFRRLEQQAPRSRPTRRAR